LREDAKLVAGQIGLDAHIARAAISFLVSRGERAFDAGHKGFDRDIFLFGDALERFQHFRLCLGLTLGYLLRRHRIRSVEYSKMKPSPVLSSAVVFRSARERSLCEAALYANKKAGRRAPTFGVLHQVVSDPQQ
jgi:hypothetical protein